MIAARKLRRRHGRLSFLSQPGVGSPDFPSFAVPGIPGKGSSGLLCTFPAHGDRSGRVRGCLRNQRSDLRRGASRGSVRPDRAIEAKVGGVSHSEARASTHALSVLVSSPKLVGEAISERCCDERVRRAATRAIRARRSTHSARRLARTRPYSAQNRRGRLRRS